MASSSRDTACDATCTGPTSTACPPVTITSSVHGAPAGADASSTRRCLDGGPLSRCQELSPGPGQARLSGSSSPTHAPSTLFPRRDASTSASRQTTTLALAPSYRIGQLHTKADSFWGPSYLAPRVSSVTSSNPTAGAAPQRNSLSGFARSTKPHQSTNPSAKPPAGRRGDDEPLKGAGELGPAQERKGTRPAVDSRPPVVPPALPSSAAAVQPKPPQGTRSDKPSLANVPQPSRSDVEQPVSPINTTVPAEHVVLVYPIRDHTSVVSITHGDTKRLGDGEYINDTLIEFGLKRALLLLTEREKKIPDKSKHFSNCIHMFNSFFYNKLTTERGPKGLDEPYAAVRKWTNKFDLFSKKYIIIPINEHLHWFLAIIVNPGALLNFLSTPVVINPHQQPPRGTGARRRDDEHDLDLTVDSDGEQQHAVPPPNEPCLIFTFDLLGGTHKVVGDHLRDYLCMEMADKRKLELDLEYLQRHVQYKPVTVPLQQNLTDCGLYLLHYVEKFLEQPEEYLEILKGGSKDSTKSLKALQEKANCDWDAVAAIGRRKELRDEVKSLCVEWKEFCAPLNTIKAKEREEKKARRLKEKEEDDVEKAALRAADNEQKVRKQPKVDENESIQVNNKAQTSVLLPPLPPPPPARLARQPSTLTSHSTAKGQKKEDAAAPKGGKGTGRREKEQKKLFMDNTGSTLLHSHPPQLVAKRGATSSAFQQAAAPTLSTTAAINSFQRPTGAANPRIFPALPQPAPIPCFSIPAPALLSHKAVKHPRLPLLHSPQQLVHNFDDPPSPPRKRRKLKSSSKRPPKS